MVPHFEDNSHTIMIDYDHASIQSRITVDLTHIHTSPNKEDSTLDTHHQFCWIITFGIMFNHGNKWLLSASNSTEDKFSVCFLFI